MQGGIDLVERPVLTMRVLLFLHENKEATLSDMLSEGWNRRTTEASLNKAGGLKLIESAQIGSFPRFEKRYHLTGKGKYTAKYVRLLEREAELCLRSEDDDFCRFPKGCLPLLAHLCRREVNRISNIHAETNIWPTQLYKCLSFLEARGIVLKSEEMRGKRTVSSFAISDVGIPLAVAADALDRALREAITQVTA